MMSEKKESKRNEKTIIALSGVEDTGKTTTIKEVCRLLLVAYPNAMVKRGYPKKECPASYKGDIWVRIKIEEMWIGIESYGDPGSRLAKSLKKFANDDPCCVVILCATRTYGATVEAVKQMEPQYKVEIIHKKDYQDNSVCAKHLFDRIKSLL